MRSLFYKIYFFMKDSSRNILRSFISSFGILFLIMFFVLYLSFRESVVTFIKGSVFDNLASDEIKILPKNSTTIDFVKKPGDPGIPAYVMAELKKMNDFSELNGLTRIGFNMRVKGELLGKSKKMYVPVCGVDRSFIRSNKIPGWKNFYNRKPVPLIIPKFTVDMLNNYFAMENLPTIPQKDLVGFPLELTFNTGTKKTENYKEYTFQSEIYNFTDTVNFPGILVPTEFLVETARLYNRDSHKNAGFEYIIIYAKVKDTKKLSETVAKLKKFGLKIESQKEISEKAQRAMNIIDGFSFAIIAIFFILSAISIFNSYLTIIYVRSQKFSLKRVLGFSKLSIVFGFILEAAIIGTLYGIAGYFSGNFLLHSASKSLPAWIPALGAIPIKAGGTSILLKCIALSSTVSAVSALIPAIFASNINLFKAVRK